MKQTAADVAPTSEHPQSQSFVRRDSCPACDHDAGTVVFDCGFTESPIIDYLQWFYSSQGATIDTGRLEEGSFRLIRCGHCSLIYQQEILSDEMMVTLYDHWLAEDCDDSGQVHQTTARTLRYVTEIKRIFEYLNKEPQTIKILDFGMGWSEWIRIAASFGAQAFGAELSDAKIRHAKRFGIEVLDWDAMTDHQFCLINTEQVFEHIPHPFQTLMHLKQCLKPDGLIKISVPNGAGIEARIKKNGWQTFQRDNAALNPAAPLEHINTFTHESILALARRAGMKPVPMPLPTQLSGFVDIKHPAASVKSILKPVYQRLRPSTYVFLTPA